jgi:hypothetical protein
MKFAAKLCIMLLAFSFLVGLGAAVCGSCNYQGGTAVEGNVIHLQGPALSPTQGRAITWAWALYECPSNTNIPFNLKSVPNSGVDKQDIYFYAPKAGDYRVALTVSDARFSTTCKDVRDMCFTTEASECPEFCCGEVCKESTPNYVGGCPWKMCWTSPTGFLVPGWTYEWYIDDTLYRVNTSAHTPGTDTICIKVDWTKYEYAVGEHKLSFEIWDEFEEQVMDCDGEDCDCEDVSDPLTPCEVRVVEKPIASINRI